MSCNCARHHQFLSFLVILQFKYFHLFALTVALIIIFFLLGPEYFFFFCLFWAFGSGVLVITPPLGMHLYCRAWEGGEEIEPWAVHGPTTQANASCMWAYQCRIHRLSPPEKFFLSGCVCLFGFTQKALFIHTFHYSYYSSLTKHASQHSSTMFFLIYSLFSHNSNTPAQPSSINYRVLFP